MSGCFLVLIGRDFGATGSETKGTAGRGAESLVVGVAASVEVSWTCLEGWRRYR